MLLKHLVLRNFRNYKNVKLTFSPGINLIYGENGAGKTNLLEAIYLLSTGRSFKSARLTDLILHGETYFYIEAVFVKNDVEESLSIGFERESRKIHYNQTKLSSFADLLGILPSVLYAPHDIALVSGAPSERRRFLNVLLAQSDSLYVRHLVRYHRAMKQRNILLKEQSSSSLSSFEHEMALSTLVLMEKRAAMLDGLKQDVKQVSESFTQGLESFEIRYLPSLASKDRQLDHETICDLLEKQREKEFIIGSTMIGPHRDDFQISLEEKRAKIFSSEGQKRTFIASLKFAEWKRLMKNSDSMPLMSIDDFGVHLDHDRLKKFQLKLSQFKQVFLTAPSLINLNATKEIFVQKNKLSS